MVWDHIYTLVLYTGLYIGNICFICLNENNVYCQRQLSLVKLKTRNLKIMRCNFCATEITKPVLKMDFCSHSQVKFCRQILHELQISSRGIWNFATERWNGVIWRMKILYIRYYYMLKFLLWSIFSKILKV